MSSGKWRPFNLSLKVCNQHLPSTFQFDVFTVVVALHLIFVVKAVCIRQVNEKTHFYLRKKNNKKISQSLPWKSYSQKLPNQLSMLGVVNFNSLRLSDANMHYINRPVLVQIMAWSKVTQV